MIYYSAVCGILQRLTCRGSNGPPQPFSPLRIQSFSGKKNERVALDERKPVIPNLTVLGKYTGDLRSQVKPSKSVLETEIFWTL